MRRDILTDLAEFGGRYDIGRLEGWGPWQEIKDRTGIRAQRSLRGQIEKLLPGKPHRASLLARSESRMTFSCHHSFGSLCALPVFAVKAWLDFHHKNTKAQRNARAWCPFVSLCLCGGFFSSTRETVALVKDHAFKVCPLFGSVSPFTLCAIQGPVRGYQKMER